MQKLGLVLALVLFGCGKDEPIEDGSTGVGSGDGGDEGGDDGGEYDCESDDECSSWEICESQECVDGDRNNSLDEAEGILWDDATSGYINPADDVDYYTFTAEGGEYIRVSVTNDSEEGDTVLVLRNPSGKTHAVVDNHPTGGSVSTYDSVMYAYLDEAGTWSLSIEDVGSYSGSVAYAREKRALMILISVAVVLFPFLALNLAAFRRLVSV